MTIYLYLPVNILPEVWDPGFHILNHWLLLNLMRSLIVIHGVVFRVFFFLASLVSNLFVPTWSVALMKTSYHTVIWMNLKIHDGCSACWTKLSNNLCAWIPWVAFKKKKKKDPRLYLVCFGKYSCLNKNFHSSFFSKCNCSGKTFPYRQKYMFY